MSNTVKARKEATRWLSQLPNTRKPEWIRGHTDDGLPDWATHWVYPATLETLTVAVRRLCEEGVHASVHLETPDMKRCYIFISFDLREMESDRELCALIPEREDDQR